MRKRITAAVFSAVMVLGMAAAPAVGTAVPVPYIAAAAEGEDVRQTDIFVNVYYNDFSGNRVDVSDGNVKHRHIDEGEDQDDIYIYESNGYLYLNSKEIKDICFEMKMPDLPDNKQVSFDAECYVWYGDNSTYAADQKCIDVQSVITPETRTFTAELNDFFKEYDKETISFNTFSIVMRVKDFTVSDYGSAESGIDISEADVKVKDKTYTGKALKPGVIVALDGKTLTKGTDYTVEYKNNKNCGKGKAVVTGTGSYTGKSVGTFIIRPKKVTAKKTISPSSKKVKVRWKKAKGGVTGYKVQIALNKKFTKSCTTVTIKKAYATEKTFKNLKKGKTYYTRVCAYKIINKKTFKGAWSKVKKVKCK